MRRVIEPELLDSDGGSAEEVRAALADLRMVNGCFGGVRTSRKLIERVVQRTGARAFTLLDVAAASGDCCLQAADQMAKRGVPVDITLLDRAASHLPRNGHRVLVGDALRLPFRDGAFDLVGCSLFAHHLEPEQVVAFIDESLRVARTAVLINDLRRSRLHLALVYAGRPLFRSPMAWSDGLISVRRAYTLAEMSALLRRTNAAAVEVSEHYLFRLGATVWKTSAVTQQAAKS
ncbi:MAG TPA: methyltransferase domain-containing protein [Terriglobales bacterium]|nr:methyltransferase domain-containing protein [Terriglobales bacterium]